MANIFTDQKYDKFEMTDFETYVFGGKKGSKQRKKEYLFDMPVILYDEEFEKGLESKKFRELIQSISDTLIFQGSTIFDEENQNQPKLYDAVNGKIDPSEYLEAEYTYGDKGVAPIRDNHFFYNAKETIIGQILTQPFKFSITTISNEFTNQVVKENAKEASKYIMDLTIQAMAENGISQMKDFTKGFASKDITTEQLISNLDTQKYLERIVYDLVSDVINKGHIKKLISKSMEDKFAINSQFAIVKKKNGEVIPERLDPSEVSWIGSTDIEDFEDPGVIACSTTKYMTLTEILNEFGHLLDTGTGKKGLLNVVKNLKKGRMNGYNPFGENIGKTTEVWHTNFSGLTSNLKEREEIYAKSMVRWMKNIFYPSKRTGLGLKYSFLVQRFYFKVIKNEKHSVLINGKKPTKSSYESWLNSGYNREEIAEFTEIKQGESTKGKFIVDKPVTIVYQATRIGHNTIIDVKPYEFASEDKNKNDFPIIAQISYDKSFALIGYNFAVWTNVIFNRLEEMIDSIGLSKMLLLDENQMSGHGDEMDFLYNAKKTGIGIYNSSRVNSANYQASMRHLTSIDLGNHAAEAENLLATIGLFKTLYENSIGASPQTQGIGSSYQGKGVTELNIKNQGLLKIRKFDEHNRFMNQVLQRMSDILKKVNAYDGTKNVIVDNNEKKFLKLTKDLDLYGFNMYLDSGFDLQQKKEIIDSLAMQIGASGGVEIIDSLIDLVITDNPQEARDIFRRSKKFLAEQNAKIAESNAAAAEQKSRADQFKSTVPIQVQQLKNQLELQKQKLENQDRDRRDSEAGIKDDIEEENMRERMYFESILRNAESENNAKIQESLGMNKE